MAVRVAIAGIRGRMGRLAASHLARAADVVLVAGIVRALGSDPDSAECPLFTDPAEAFTATRPEIVVDLSVMPGSRDVAFAALAHGVVPIVGATGWDPAAEAELDAGARHRGLPAAIVPNFALGAVLAMRFAEEAARWFPTVEIVELHHDGKRDAPSGTAALTARRIARVRGGEPPAIHSVRLRGLVAHQEVLFGGEGEVLTLRHDSLSRDSFAAGILLAVRAVRSRPPGLALGLESRMGEPG